MGTSAGHQRGLLVATSGDLTWPPARTFSWPRTVGVGEALLGFLLGPMGLTRQQASFTRDDVVRGWAALLPEGASGEELDRLADATLSEAAVVAVVAPVATPLCDALVEARFTTV